MIKRCWVSLCDMINQPVIWSSLAT